jgi:hypothetical protein
MYFEFEKLDLYKVTLDFVAAADDVAEALPKGRRYLKDQLRRGQFNLNEKPKSPQR